MRADLRLGRVPVIALVLLALAAVAGFGTAAAAQAKPSAHGSVQQVYATGLAPSRTVSLLSRRGAVVQRRRADSLGGVVFRLVPAGRGYRVRQGRSRSGPLYRADRSLGAAQPRIYDQRIPTGGYGYLRTRDGTKLADRRAPARRRPAAVSDAGRVRGLRLRRPGRPESGIAPIANLLGFAVVDVNMRGTGCSGGSFDYFEPLQISTATT